MLSTPPETSRWYFRLFGGFEARCGMQVVARMRTAKTASLLAYLVVHPPHRFAREALADRFWGELPPERARNNLSVALNALRHALVAPHTPTPLLQTDAHAVALHPDGFSADVLEFERALDVAAQASDPATQYQQLTQAVNLYQGEFMAGYYDDWILQKAAELQTRCLHALEQLAQMSEERGDLASAQQWLHRALELAPLDSEILFRLATLYLHQGQADVAWQVCAGWVDYYQRVQNRPPPSAIAQLMDCCRSQMSAPARPTQTRRRARADKPPSLPVALSLETPQTPTPALMPAVRTRFFGRAAEVERILTLLRDPAVACVTLTGLGGVGKTRLALEIASRLQTEGEFTLFWIPLLAAAHPNQLLGAIAEALGLPRVSDPLAQLAACLNAQSNPLLIMDNFEHLLPEGAIVLADLLQAAPAVRCLITSRLPLQLSMEHVQPVSPLTCTESRECPALQLFVDRAQQVAHDFRLTEQNLPIIQSLCRQLDGIPLALELAAARLNVLSPRQMLANISERLDWLKTHRHDLSERHRELRLILDATFALLSSDAQRALQRLSVLPGAWSLPLAQTLCFPDRSLNAVAEWLQELSGASLIVSQGANFEMLEVVREYAQSQLSESEREALRSALCQWALQTARARRAEAYTPQLRDWLDFWDEARPLLFEALTLLEQRGEVNACVELMEATARYWSMRPLHADALARLTRLTAHPALTPDAQVRARLLSIRLLFDIERHPEALALAQQAFELCPDEHPLRGWTLYWLVQLAFTLRQMPLVEQHWEALRAFYPSKTDSLLHSAIHYLMGYLEPPADTVAWREEGVRFARAVGDPMLLRSALDSLSESLILTGEYERALRSMHEERTLCQLLGDSVHLVSTLHQEAHCLLQQGHLEAAEQKLGECEPLLTLVGHPSEASVWIRAQILRWRGELQAALDLVLSQVAPLEARQRLSFAASMLDLAMVISRQLGDLDAAWRYGGDALRLRLREPDPYRERFTRTHYAYIRALLNEASAVEDLQECMLFWGEREVRPWQATTLAYLAEIHALQGDLENARAALEEAIQLNRQMGRRLALHACEQLRERFGL